MIQAQFVDLDVYFRTGGVNWELTKLNQDAVAIQAGVGTWANPLLQEQVNGAIQNSMPFFTWWIPDIRDGSMQSQVDFYLGLPGVRGARKCVDIEPPGGGTRCVNAPEALAVNQRIEDVTGERPLCYSNKKYITEDLKSPAWLPNYKWWLAQYIYKVYPVLFYTDYSSFLAKYGSQLPPSAKELGLESKTIAWQFSYKGDAQRLCANARTLDPVYPYGIKECDLAVSTIEKAEFLAWLGAPPVPPALPEIVGTKGNYINFRNLELVDVGDINGVAIPVIGETAEHWIVTGKLAKSVTEPR